MASGTLRKPLLFWGTVVFVVALDVLTKAWAEQSLLLYVPQRVLGDVVRFTLAYNPGAAFSMSVGEYSRYVFSAIAVVALLALYSIYRGAAPGERLKILATALVWSGAFGNLLDRLRSPRGVVDFIDIGVGSVRFWTFNVADSGVTVGAILLAVVLWREEHAAAQERSADTASSSGATEEAGARGAPPQD